MVRTALLLACGLVWAAEARADLLDAQLVRVDGQPHLWVSFDDQPIAVRQAGARGLELDGVAVSRTRMIEPAVRAGFSALRVQPSGDGVRLDLDGGAAIASAELRQGGVLIRLDMDAGAPSIAVAEAETGSEAQAERPAAAMAPQTEMASAAPEPSQMAEADPPSARRAAGGPMGLQPQAAPVEASASEPAAQPASVDPSAIMDNEPSGPCAETSMRLAETPWDLNILVEHADCMVEAGEPDNAAGLYERVLAFEPTHFRAALGLARLRAASGQNAAAAQLFETAAGSAMTDGEALQARAAARRAREAAQN